MKITIDCMPLMLQKKLYGTKNHNLSGMIQNNGIIVVKGDGF